MVTYQGAYHLLVGVVPGRQDRGHDSIPTYRAFTAADGTDVMVTANTDGMWQALCSVLEIPELVDSPTFATAALRQLIAADVGLRQVTSLLLRAPFSSSTHHYRSSA